MKDDAFLYEKIYRELAGEILSGVKKEGDKVSTEEELTKAHGVSRITAKRALNMLADAGLVERRRGLGTFVAKPGSAKPSAQGPAPAGGQRSRRIGLIMEDLGESYSLGLFYALDRQAKAQGLQLCLEVSYGDQANEREALGRLLSLDIGGLLIMPAHGQYYNTDLLRLVLAHFPVVLIDRPLHGIPAPSIYTDNEAACAILTRNLIENGYAGIAYVTTDTNEAISLEERYTGYKKAMLEAGLSVLPPVIIPRLARFGLTKDSIAAQDPDQEDFLLHWLELSPGITGVIGSEYGVAALARQAAVKLHKRIPQDLAICCFDAKYGYLGEFDFTHIKQDEAAIAKSALEVLSDMMEGKNMRREVRLIPATLMAGASTARK